MKAKIFVGLSFALLATLVSVCAEDTPAQAAARAALAQKMNELDHPQARPLPEPGTSSNAVTALSGRPGTNVTATIPEKAATVPAAPAPPRPQPATIPAATKSSGPSAVTGSTTEITTVSGITYKNVLVEKVDSDGIVISYGLANGGMEMVKIYADELPDALRQKYGFGPGK